MQLPLPMIDRRRFLHVATASAALAAMSRRARALDYPTRPVRLIVGLPAGGTPDIYARLIAERLSARLGQAVVVENRPGGGGNIATELVIRAAPDGYTLLLVIAPNVINASLYPDLKYNFLRDTAPVAGIGGSPFVMVVNPAFSAKTVPQFIAYAKANPGKINVGSTGVGNLTHMAAELFKMMAGVDMLHVPYRGETAAQADLLSDRVQVMFDPIPSSLGYIRSGKLRPLAVTSATAMELLPGVPPMTQVLPGYVVTGVTGISAPKGTPAAIIGILNQAINAALAEPAIKTRFAALGSIEALGTPADFGNLLIAETAKWAKVITSAHIKPE
ncbi:MAG: tripartite tricarboxylate transporter substrate binding protein [Xanthobacteraceae bacterium]